MRVDSKSEIDTINLISSSDHTCCILTPSTYSVTVYRSERPTRTYTPRQNISTKHLGTPVSSLSITSHPIPGPNSNDPDEHTWIGLSSRHCSMPVASALPLPISSNTPRFPFAMPGTTPHTAPPRAPSASSHISSTTHTSRDTPQSMYYKSQNGSTSDMPDGYEDVGLTPQPHFPSQHYGGPSYLPPMTTSPPPHTPTYVPPPQHALPPDPIHALGFNPTYGQHPNITTQMAGPSQWSSGWRNGPTPGPSNFPYRIPNGHASAGPLPDGYLQQQQRHAMSIGPPGYSAQSGQGLVNGLPRPGSASGDMREPRRRERSHQRERDEDGDREDEVISTIFVVGFPDDMSVSRSDL